MVKVGKDQHEAALKLPQVSEMDFTGRPMKGFVYCSKDASEGDLEDLLRLAANGAFPSEQDSEEPKKKSPKKRKSDAAS